jgi:hypothetical protein
MNLLNLRFRLELKEKKFDRAIYTLQTGLTLSRHVGNGTTLIELLVGNAFAARALEWVQEWMRTAGSPDLYWSLTALPSPFFDLRSAMACELQMLHRSYPTLRRLNVREGSEALTGEEVEHLANELIVDMVRMSNGNRGFPTAAERVEAAWLVSQALDGATKYLVNNGWKKERIKAMTANEAALRYLVGQYDEVCADVLRWVSVPPWQGQDEVTKTDQRVRAAFNASHNPFIHELFPAVVKVYQSCLRTERQIAAFRCAEALRMYAAAHGGKVPAKLADVTDVPLPIDPGTGKGFDNNYTEGGGIGILEVHPLSWIWRFEIAERK